MRDGDGGALLASAAGQPPARGGDMGSLGAASGVGGLDQGGTEQPVAGSSGKSVGLWVELQPAEVEVDGGLEVLAVAVAAG